MPDPIDCPPNVAGGIRVLIRCAALIVFMILGAVAYRLLT